MTSRWRPLFPALLVVIGVSICQARDAEDQFGTLFNHTHARVKRESIPEYGVMSAPEIIRHRGYPVERHKVVTKDGYVLEMHRIPGPHKHRFRGRTRFDLPARGRVVYIQHCVLCSSGDFVLNDPHEAISFVLADVGFDVWLGNYRGNSYSKGHLHLSPDEPEFWKFSFMEMAKYDIPAMIYYVLEKTGHANLSYIGHSMGTTGLFAANSMMPELNHKVRVFAALAPVAYLDHVIGPFRHLFQLAKYSFRFLEKINKAEQLPRSKTISALVKTFCGADSVLIKICKAIIPAMVGVNPGYISPEHIQIVLSHIPAGTSSRTLAHFGQIVDAGSFRMFDMGHEENLRHYGTPYPPPFELKRTVVPVGLFWADNDWVSTPKDVARIASELPHVALNYRVPQHDFNHLDFLFSETSKYVLYNQLTRFILDH